MAVRIVVAADNPSLSLGLTGLDYDVVAVRPSDFDIWAPETDEAQVLIIGVEEPAQALDIARRADSRRSGIPVLVVAGDTAAWGGIDSGDNLNLRLLPLPITRPSLVAAVEALSAPAPSTGAGPAPDPVVATPSADNGQEQPAAARSMIAARSTNMLRSRLAQRPAASEPVVETRAAETTPAIADNEVAGAQPSPPPADKQPVISTEPVAPPPPAARRTPAYQHASTLLASSREVRELITDLLSRVGQLNDVRDAAAAVIEEAASVTGATSGVVMLPDGDDWRVTGATGVRPLEWRYIVEASSWIVTTVVSGDRGLIVEDSDIARQRLGGAPLTHHKQLMAAPVRGPNGLILMARDTEPFTEVELTALVAVASDAGPMLADALLLRDLARALSDFRGSDG